MKLSGLEKYFLTNEDGEIIDFTQINIHNFSPLMYAFISNKTSSYNLNKEQWEYLIKNSDLKHVDNYGWSTLIYALRFNQLEDVNLNKEQWEYLIKNPDLKQLDKDGLSPLMYMLRYNKSENLTNKNWKYLIDNSDLSLITKEYDLIKLKKIQLELLNDDILNKINITEEITKKVKI